MKKPDNTAKPVAKSLHTLTVIYQTACYILLHGEGAPSIAGALEEAMQLLELAGRPDPYGLQARALALMVADRDDALKDAAPLAR